MIKHVVCFKLKDNSMENCLKIRDILMTMKDKIHLLKDIQVGIDCLHSPRSYDIILETMLENEEALEAYQKDQYHCEVIKKYMNDVSDLNISLDYYLD